MGQKYQFLVGIGRQANNLILVVFGNSVKFLIDRNNIGQRHGMFSREFYAGCGTISGAIQMGCIDDRLIVLQELEMNVRTSELSVWLSFASTHSYH